MPWQPSVTLRSEFSPVLFKLFVPCFPGNVLLFTECWGRFELILRRFVLLLLNFIYCQKMIIGFQTIVIDSPTIFLVVL